MKYIYLPLIACVLLACGNGGKTAVGSGGTETLSKDASYALGLDIGSSLQASDLYPNFEEFIQGMRDILTDANLRFSLDEAYEILNDEFGALAQVREAENIQAEIEFLLENSRNPGIIVTGSGLQYEVLVEGSGAKPTAFDTVRVHYEGALTNGMIFDSSYSRGEPLEFPLLGVIPGWTEGLQLMSVGSIYRLFIPSDLGYGPQGAGGQIPPYATLIFEVELLDIIR